MFSLFWTLVLQRIFFSIFHHFSTLRWYRKLKSSSWKTRTYVTCVVNITALVVNYGISNINWMKERKRYINQFLIRWSNTPLCFVFLYHILQRFLFNINLINWKISSAKAAPDLPLIPTAKSKYNMNYLIPSSAMPWPRTNLLLKACHLSIFPWAIVQSSTNQNININMNFCCQCYCPISFLIVNVVEVYDYQMDCCFVCIDYINTRLDIQ